MSDLKTAIYSKIIECEKLILSTNLLLSKGLSGAKRLQARLYAENQFLSRLLKKPDQIKEEHLRGTNLSHLAAILSCINSSENVVDVLKPISWTNCKGHSCQLTIDIIADFGSTWIKIVARNPQALLHSTLGASSYGKRTLIEQAKDLSQCVKFHPYLYKPPKIKVHFASGVTSYLVSALQKLNIESIGTIVEPDDNEICNLLGSDSDDEQDKNAVDDLFIDENCLRETSPTNEQQVDNLPVNIDYNFALRKNKILLSLAEIPKNATLNLDVSTLICYVSNLTNGNCSCEFQDKILTEQAQRERCSPIKPILDELFTERRLVCCQMAFDDFQEILSVVGGPSERQRATELLSRVELLANSPSQSALSLSISSKIKQRSRVVFGTGDAIESITVTANQGFLRAAEAQGVNFVSFLHESRALTEMKEETTLNNLT